LYSSLVADTSVGW